MKRLNSEQVQDLIRLTPKQEKVFDNFIKAVRQCKKEYILFYIVLDTIFALNGKNVSEIHVDEDVVTGYNGYDFDPYENNFVINNGFCGFADDTHYLVFKEDSIGKDYETGYKGK